MAKYRGTGKIANSDFKAVKWVGVTKSGASVTIEFANAVNLGNIDWSFAEKDETVAQIVMTAVYDNTDATATSTTEPWTIEIDGTLTNASDEIMLGAGIFYVGNTAIALTRGGGSFSVERTVRNINADGDRGPVKGRIAIDDSTATLTMNALTILTRLSDLYSGIETVNE